MKIKNRISKLEKKMTIPKQWKVHRIIIKGKEKSAVDAIKEFKRTHTVGADDDFNIFHLIEPDHNRFRRMNGTK
jgi:hypothetical protein